MLLLSRETAQLKVHSMTYSMPSDFTMYSADDFLSFRRQIQIFMQLVTRKHYAPAESSLECSKSPATSASKSRLQAEGRLFLRPAFKRRQMRPRKHEGSGISRVRKRYNVYGGSLHQGTHCDELSRAQLGTYVY